MTADDTSHADQADRPGALGLLVSTLLLMTSHAAPDPAPGMDGPRLQRLLARKVARNLFFLQHHPDVPPKLRQMAGQLHGAWAALAFMGVATLGA